MKKISELTKLVRDKAQKWSSGKMQGRAEPVTGETASSDQQVFISEEMLLKSFEQVCHVVEQENILLQNDAPLEAMGLLAQKTAAIENLHALLETFQTQEQKPEALSESLLQTQKQFTDLLERNSELLVGALHTQSVVMKIFVDAATKDAQQSYNHAGTMVTDDSRTRGSFNNNI